MQCLEDIRMDSEKDNYVENSLPEISIEVEPVQLINQLLEQLTTKPSNKIYPTTFSGTAAENIVDSKGLKGLTGLLHIMYVMTRNNYKSSLYIQRTHFF